MADAALRDLERRAATTDDPADREALARARLRAGLEPGDWVHAERDWAEDPTLERLDVLAQLAERYAKIPAALVKMVVSRPMQGQRLRTRHGDGLCVGNARSTYIVGGHEQTYTRDGRRIRLDDGTERNFSRSAISNRVLDPVTWLTTHKGGKRWARGWCCPDHIEGGECGRGESCVGCSKPVICGLCAGRSWDGEDLRHESFCRGPKREERDRQHRFAVTAARQGSLFGAP